MRQEDQEFEASLVNTARLPLKNKQRKNLGRGWRCDSVVELRHSNTSTSKNKQTGGGRGEK
jgi:hypothetical protein